MSQACTGGNLVSKHAVNHQPHRRGFRSPTREAELFPQTLMALLLVGEAVETQGMGVELALYASCNVIAGTDPEATSPCC